MKLSKNSIKLDQLVKNMAYPPPMALINLKYNARQVNPYVGKGQI